MTDESLPRSEPPEPGGSPLVAEHGPRIPRWTRALLVVGLLYLFLVGVKLLESGVRSLGSDTAGGLFDGITNPLAALFVATLVSLAGCAHPNLTVRSRPTAPCAKGTQSIGYGFATAELVRELQVPYRKSYSLPIAEKTEAPEAEKDFDLDGRFDELFAAISPTG